MVPIRTHGKHGEDGSPELSLRPLDLSDKDEYMVWATDGKVSRFCSWDTFTSKEAGIAYIKNTIIPYPWFRAICLDDKVIGAILVSANNAGNRCRGELGYVLTSKYWGKRIATRAVKMVASTIFKEWPHLERMEALVDVENGGLKKAGFQREGVLRKFYSEGE